MKPRAELPDLADTPKSAFLCGWWSGNATGFVIGMAVAMVLLKAIR